MTPPSTGPDWTGLSFAPLLLALPLLGCPSTATDPPDDDDSADADDDDATPTFGVHDVGVIVTLDGEATAGIRVAQGGRTEATPTDASGAAVIAVDFDQEAEHWLIASHPEARQRAVLVPEVWSDGDPDLQIELRRFDPSDNADYAFHDPGDPERRGTTNLCAHCHVTMNAAWVNSAHRGAARNPVVQDLYAGAASGFEDEGACLAAGGRWRQGIAPGQGMPGMRCYIGAGTLPDLNPGCDEIAPCDGAVDETGACADCHAPGIDGALGGRDLLEATGISYDNGVHCDVCHKVESVIPDAPAGVAGRLHLVRPSEPNNLLPFQPLTFGPFHDVGNPFMGAVQRDHFLTPALCSGCHELWQRSLVGVPLDPERWPGGTLPIHTTVSEWAATPLNPSVPCQGCHMPADSTVTNAADLQLLTFEPGVASGWERPPGSVRQHAFDGPRTEGSALAPLALRLVVISEVADGVQTVTVTSKNVGAGHSVPTGEPMRAVLLLVESRCGDAPLAALGGDAVPDFGGALDQKESDGDWGRWPGASVGDIVRVVAFPGGWYDYPGVGSFGDGTFDSEARGLPVQEVVGSSTVVSVQGDEVTFDAPLPPGDRAYRGDDRALAGAPGFAFARVLVDAEGQRMAPHHRAVDVASDNRLPAGAAFTTTHRFPADCAAPEVSARLIHRAYPEPLRRQRGWAERDLVLKSWP